MAPADEEFQHAATWAFSLPDPHAPDLSDVRLRLRYNGDVARLRSGKHLVDDNFWNGLPWELSVRDLRAEDATGRLTLQILPWPHNPSMYLEAHSADFPTTPILDAIPQYKLEVDVSPK